MKITRVTFDGTTDEFKEIAGIFMQTSPGVGAGEIDASASASVEEKHGLSVKDAYRALLTRREISPAQVQMFNVLAEGELSYVEYLKRMKRTPQEIAGVHGAFGRRVNNTPEIHQAGLPGNMSAAVEWRKEKGMDYLRLRDEFLEVLQEEGII